MTKVAIIVNISFVTKVGEREREVARAQAANSALQDRVRELEVVSADGGDGEELRRIIREKDKVHATITLDRMQ